MAADPPLLEFYEVMRRLRAECPWKREQTHRSLSRYLVEELHETLEAIDVGSPVHLREELGDLLLQIYFHAAIAEESGDFTLDDVARGITEKMRRRNPHVFAPGPDDPEDPEDAAAVNERWQQIKDDERPGRPLDAGLPPTLPALLYADKVLDRLARRSGSDPGRGGGDPGDLGDRLLGLVAEARGSGVDPEQALRDAVRRRLAES